MTGILCVLAGAVPKREPETLTVTVDTTGGPAPIPTIQGFSSIEGIGSISPGTLGLLGGATVLELARTSLGGGRLFFTVSGVYSNSGWSTLTINSLTFNRADANFDTSTGDTKWSWTTADSIFGADGTTRDATFAP
jgi:hypothetical protein